MEVHYYRPLAGKWFGRLLGRVHQKIAVIDGRVGFTGGFGIWKVSLLGGRGGVRAGAKRAGETR